ncbi:uncharacterized protein C8Q71DRAFT_780993 [Rhodofomes roseus]|uniref:F-box domain-containing protein n=1 Tax=Rhodofomes roseus TaxID=34475 RepID=A0ABQ8K4A0_9APHY|nr:uncharacterized protein C8Q71DRAFT_780993 [Rhodofomes roseus]KAH9831526.1 hypothetical protein C8Q71DRAFT_780993 [Rhodofomes roseus]
MTEGVDTLRRLNPDVLLSVFEHSLPERGLRSLSMACRWVREETMPALFRRCLVAVAEPLCAERFLPQRLWPYVCHLSLRDECPDVVAMNSTWNHQPQFTDDPLLCGIMDPEFLGTTLPAMPRLQSIHLGFLRSEVHGIGWDTLAAILSTPQLRSFTVAQFMFSPRQSSTMADFDSLAPLTTFRYEQRFLRTVLHQFPSQEAALGTVIGKSRHTLESLLLPSEIAPFRVLMTNQWPRLEELHLIGVLNLARDAHIPFVTLFAGMPRLRVLNLQLAVRKHFDQSLLQLWPQDREGQLPWPNLEDLVMSFPNLEDRVYSHLPRTLRRLTLRCTPHHSFDIYKRYHPPLKASEMLKLLSGVDVPHLTYILLEYCADVAEDDLLLYVVQRFPQLTSLELHRSTSREGNSMTITDVALRLASLPNLFVLRAYLEFGYPSRSFEKLQQIATVLARKVARPGLELWLLHHSGGNGAVWYPVRLVAEEGVDQEPRAEISHFDNGAVSAYPFNY